jgi:hypothetical protein
MRHGKRSQDMPATTIAIIAIYLGFALLELLRTGLLA